MALQSCYNYWLPKVINATIGETLIDGVVLVSKFFPEEGEEGTSFFTLRLDNYGEITYKEEEIGTENNPYAIATIDDFIWWFKDNHTNTDENNPLYINMVSDIDFNESEECKFGYNITTVASYNSNEDFNGLNYTIRNLLFSDRTISIFRTYRNSGRIRNLIFENVIILNVSSNADFLGSNFLKNIRVGCYLFNSTTLILKSQKCEDCTFNIKGSSSGKTIIIGDTQSWSPSCTRCWFNYDLILNSENTTQNQSLFYTGGNFSYSYITGKVVLKENSSTYRLYQDSANMKFGYIAVKIDNVPKDANNKYLMNFSGAGNNYSFFCIMDKDGNDILTELATTPSENCHVISVANAKNPSYLLAQGFPVGEIEQE